MEEDAEGCQRRCREAGCSCSQRDRVPLPQGGRVRFERQGGRVPLPQGGRVHFERQGGRGGGREAGCVSAQSVTRVAVQSMCFHTATWSSAKPLIRSVMLQRT